MASFIRTVARFLDRKSLPGLNAFGAIGGVVLVAMMMIVVADAIGRRFFTSPVHGAYEAVCFMLSVLFFFSIIYCAVKRRHFAINIVTTYFQPKVRLKIVTIVYFISALMSWVLAWQLVVFGLAQKASGTTGMDFTFLPIYPFILLAGFCCVILGWVFLVQTIYFLREAIKGIS